MTLPIFLIKNTLGYLQCDISAGVGIKIELQV